MWWWAPTVQTTAGARPTRTRNSPWVTFVLARYSSASSCLRCPTGQSITGMPWALAYPRTRRLNRPAKPHQVSVFERLIRSSQRPPPHPEPARIMAHAEIGVQNDPVDAIVAAAQQIAIESAQPVRHARHVIGRLPFASNCPAGATFFPLRLRKNGDFSSENRRQKEFNKREADVRRQADRRSAEWLCRRGGRRLRVCCRAGNGRWGDGGSGCWRVGRRAACGRTERAGRPVPLLR